MCRLLARNGQEESLPVLLDERLLTDLIFPQLGSSNPHPKISSGREIRAAIFRGGFSKTFVSETASLRTQNCLI